MAIDRGCDQRAVSSTIGFVLIMGIIVLSTVLVVTLGANAIGNAEDRADSERVQKVMTEMDSRAALVALGGSSSQQIQLPAAGTNDYEVNPDAGWITVKVKGGTKFLNKEPLGEITYNIGNKKIAYQGGGVWLKQGNGNRMISPPEFNYRGRTLTLPLVTVSKSSDESIDGKITLSQAGQESKTSAATNPISSSTVVVIVKSDYARAWGKYFEERTEGEVKKLSDNKVKIELVAPTTGPPPIGGGLVSGTASSDLELKSGALIDSYDSQTGGGYDGGAPNTKVMTAGNIEMKKNSEIKGGAIIEGKVTMKKGSFIQGDLNYGSKDFWGSESYHVGGTASPGASVPDANPVDDKINSMRNKYSGSSNNDNDDHPTVISKLESTDGGTTCTSGCTLTSGNYYLSSMELDGTLVLDTSGSGDINIVVDGKMELKKGAQIDVAGPGRVDVYLEGNFEMSKGGTVKTDSNEDARRFWIYMNPGASAEIKAKSVYTGVIYGPGPTGGSGAAIEVKAKGEVFGALVGNIGDIKAKEEIHYDEALASTDVFSDPATSAPKIRYLHVSVNQIQVTD